MDSIMAPFWKNISEFIEKKGANISMVYNKDYTGLL